MLKHRNLVTTLPITPEAKKARIRWLIDHPVWTYPAPDVGAGPDFRDGGFYEAVQSTYLYVDPKTGAVAEDETANTALRVRLEGGPWEDLSKVPGGMVVYTQWTKWASGHDIRLDCGAFTVEEALLKLAALVECFYNEDGTDRERGWWCSWENGTCEPDAENYCTKCGFHIED